MLYLGPKTATTNRIATYDELSSLLSISRKTASYSLVLADQDKLIEMNVATANTVTIPLNSTQAFPIGSQIIVSQYGAGVTTIVATGGVTVNFSGLSLQLAARYSFVTLIKIATDEWYAVGDVEQSAGGGSGLAFAEVMRLKTIMNNI